MIGFLAMRLAIVEYRLVLRLSVARDPMMAQFTMKNVAAPHRHPNPQLWSLRPQKLAARRARCGAARTFAVRQLVGPLLSPPRRDGLARRGGEGRRTPRFLLFSFDAMVLIILAVASTFGARVISLLRRQIAEARHLGQYRLRRRSAPAGWARSTWPSTGF